MSPTPATSVSPYSVFPQFTRVLVLGFFKKHFYPVIAVFQQLEIDYIIGEKNKELLPNSTGPAAILRIFGVTREGLTSLSVLIHYFC